MGTPTTSAGGIVIRKVGQDIQIVIVEWEKNVPPKWAPILRQLPKGGVKPGETLEIAALREVLEETGYQAQIISKAGEASWRYTRDGVVWDETVHYFFMTTNSSEATQDHDDEFDYVRWISINEAALILSYPEEKNLLKGVIEKDIIPASFRGKV